MNTACATETQNAAAGRDSLQLLWAADPLLHTAVFRSSDAKMLRHPCSQVQICSLSIRFLERKSTLLYLLLLLPSLAFSFTEVRSDTKPASSDKNKWKIRKKRNNLFKYHMGNCCFTSGISVWTSFYFISPGRDTSLP